MDYLRYSWAPTLRYSLERGLRKLEATKMALGQGFKRRGGGGWRGKYKIFRYPLTDLHVASKTHINFQIWSLESIPSSVKIYRCKCPFSNQNSYSCKYLTVVFVYKTKIPMSTITFEIWKIFETTFTCMYMYVSTQQRGT